MAIFGSGTGSWLFRCATCTDKLQALQFIAPDKRFGQAGDKRDKNFLSGGKTTGAFFTLSENPEGPIVICEGYATGASIHQATGYAVICAMSCGNLAVVAKALRRKWPHREMVVAADNDQWGSDNPGLRGATEAANAVHARVAMPRFGNRANKPTDFNDLHRLEGLPAVKSQIECVRTSNDVVGQPGDNKCGAAGFPVVKPVVGSAKCS